MCIPAIALVIYYRKFKNTTAKGSLVTLGLSAVVVALILYGLVPGFIEIAQYFELFFVNTVHMPFNFGVLIYAVLLVAALIWCIYSLYKGTDVRSIRWSFLLAVLLSGIPFIGESLWIPIIITSALAIYLWKAPRLPIRILGLAALSVLVMFVGYSSYALLLIRSSANPPMNQTAPDNGDAALCLFNKANSTKSIKYDLSKLADDEYLEFKKSGSYQVHNLWTDERTTDSVITATLPKHSVKVFRIKAE